jgi:hypothetical protein
MYRSLSTERLTISELAALPLIDPHVPGLMPNAFEPGSDCRKPNQVDAALVRQMRIRVQRNVGDRAPIACKKCVNRQALLHYVEREGRAQVRQQKPNFISIAGQGIVV